MQSSTRLGDSQNRSRYPAKWMKLNDLPNILFPQVSKPKYLDENYQFKPDTSGDMKDGLPQMIDTLGWRQRKKKKKPTTTHIRHGQSKSLFLPSLEDNETKDLQSSVLKGQRFSFNEYLDVQSFQSSRTSENQGTLPKDVQIGKIRVSKLIALPLFCKGGEVSQRKSSITPTPRKSERKYTEIPDIVERVRVKQVDILRKVNARQFSKEIQHKLKDELFQILKQFQ